MVAHPVTQSSKQSLDLDRLPDVIPWLCGNVLFTSMRRV